MPYTRRKSMKRTSMKRKSMKRTSMKRKSMKRTSMKRKSMKRKSMKRTSMKRKSKLLYGGWSKKNIVKELYPGVYILNNKFIGGESDGVNWEEVSNWTMPKRVTFAEKNQTRRMGHPMTEEMEDMRKYDGPDVVTTLLDKLIITHFEKRTINNSEDVIKLVGLENLRKHGESIKKRMEGIVNTLNSNNKVNILPSNARLERIHAIRLKFLLRYLEMAIKTANL